MSDPLEVEARQESPYPQEGDGQHKGTGRISKVIRRLALLTAMLSVLPVLLCLVYWVFPPVTSLMLSDLSTLRPYDRRWVSIRDIAPVMVRSVVVSEDGRYCQHHGVDWEALQEVLDHAGRNGPSRGASTITMQTVKNVFLWPGRTALRKGLEIVLAELVSTFWTKRRTMEIYLNVAEWGDGIYGIEAASQTYFHVPAARLTAQQAALLTAALPNPFLRNPAKPGRGHRRIASIIQNRQAGADAFVSCVYE